jgi:hypothetical protein
MKVTAIEKTKKSQSNIRVQLKKGNTNTSSVTDRYFSASEKSNYRFPPYEYDTECDEKRSR